MFSSGSWLRVSRVYSPVFQSSLQRIQDRYAAAFPSTIHLLAINFLQKRIYTLLKTIVVMQGNEAHAEADKDPLGATLSGPSTPAQTVSEIYPDDSASHRHVKHEEQTTVHGTWNDNPSVASLHSSEAQSLYTLINGRTFTSQSDFYALPADPEEHRRLDIQHRVLWLSLKNLFPFEDSIAHAIHNGQTTQPQVLDLGTGSGQWALDMARVYPWTKVVGIDLVPPALVSKDDIPANCRFEVDDANLPLDHYVDTFSLVHTRCVTPGLNDINNFFYQVARILKPGGVFIMADGDLQIRDESFEPLPFVQPGEPGFTWIQYLCGHVIYASWNRCGAAASSRLWWKEWLDANPNYSETRIERVDIPIGGWKQGISEREALASLMLQQDLIRVCEAWRRLLLGDGHREEDVSFWIEEGIKELRETRVRAYLRFEYYVSVRSSNPWEERDNWNPEDPTCRTVIKGIDLRLPWKRPDESYPHQSS